MQDPADPAAGEPGLHSLAAALQEACLAASLTVATAESCTGGRIGDILTDIPGSSGYLRGGIIAYADDVKVTLLGVGEDVIRLHGAVSAQVARAMAIGARGRCEVDFAVAVTGIAGPGGERPGKPVGLTYIAVAGPGGVTVRRETWSGDRLANKSATARAGIALLLDAVAAHVRG